MQMKTMLRTALTALPIFMTSAAQAQPIVVADSGDSAWVLAASAITLAATVPGLALFYGRDRNAAQANAMFLSSAIASLTFAVIGYSLAFGEGSSIIGGYGNILLTDMAELRGGTTISDTVFAMFQMSLAVFAVGIMVSSITGHARTSWLAGFVTLWSVMVYAPIAHWIWGGGWLSSLGVMDFGGGMVVQVAAGTAALVLALLLERGPEGSEPGKLSSAGLALIWIGWLAVIGGSALGGGDDAATAMLNAHFAASAALLTGFVISRWRKSVSTEYSSGMAAIAGLAAISTGAVFVGTGGAIAIGFLGAVAALLGSRFIALLKVNKTAETFVASGCGGIVGAIVFPIFVSPIFGGPGFDENIGLPTQMIAQSVGVLVVILWSGVVTAVVALMVSMVAPMRVSKRP